MAQDDGRLQRLITSYVNAHDGPQEDLEELKRYVRQEGLGDVPMEELHQRVQSVRDSRKLAAIRFQQQATLFTREKSVRTYRFGSPFCPNCHLFKNYEKECPHCSHLEMTY